MSTLALKLNLLVCMVVLCGAARAQERFPPVDKAANDETFAAFRADILDAIRRKDAEFVRSILTKDIRNSFGGDGGIREFEGMWNLDSDESTFWAEFESVIRLGGTFSTPDQFWAPYVFSLWPDSIDAFEHAAVTGTNVNVRAGPSITAPIVAQASHEIVRLEEGLPPAEWLRIALADGTSGYMSARYLRSPVDYRASFVRVDDEWMLQFFVAGD